MAQNPYQPLSTALPNLNFAQSAQNFSNGLKNAGNIQNKPNLGAGALNLAQGLRNQGAQPLGVKPKAPTDGLTKPATVLPANQVKPVTNADGGFTDSTGKVHAPDSLEAINNRTMGTNTPTPPVTPPVTPKNAPQTTQTEQPMDTGLYGKYASRLAESTSQNKTLSDRAQQIATEAGQTMSDIGRKGAMGEAGYITTGTSPVGEGNAAVLAQTTAAQQQAVAQGANMQLAGTGQGLTAQAQTQSGLTGLLGTIPEALRYGSAGLTQGGSTGSPFLDAQVQQALQMVKSGARSDDPQVQSLLSNPINKLAFNQAMGGGYNPTAQSATAGQNVSQAISYQGAATDLDTQLKNLDNVSTIATNFLNNKEFLNPNEVPDINAGIGTYIGKFIDPAAKLQYNLIMGDIGKFTSAILSTNTGQIPTAVTNTLQTFDPSTLNVKQLIPYLQTLKELGGNQLSILQGQSQASGGGGYSGAQTAINTSVAETPRSTVSGGSQISNQYAQAGIGTAMDWIGGIKGVIQGVAGYIFGKLK